MLDKLLNRAWAMDEETLLRWASLIQQRLDEGKEPLPQYLIKKPDYQMRVVATSYYQKAPVRNAQDKVAVIPIKGTMSREGDWCSYGTEDYMTWLNRANADPEVKGIVLEINSPGGDVDGTEGLAQAVATSKKPVVAWTPFAASAAYWVGSQAAELMLEGATSFVGSIGVYGVHVDMSKALEAKGMKVTLIRADGSGDKAILNSYEPLTEQVLADSKPGLNYIREQFVSAVQAGRGDRLKTEEDIFSGRMYDAKRAGEFGMADSQGTLQDAIDRAAKLGRELESATHKPQNSKMENEKYPKVQAIVGADAEIGGPVADALEAALGERDDRITALEGEKTKLGSDLATAQKEANEYATVKGELGTLRAWKANAEKSVNPAPDDTTNKGKGNAKEEKEASDFDTLSAKYPSLMADLQPAK